MRGTSISFYRSLLPFCALLGTLTALATPLQEIESVQVVARVVSALIAYIYILQFRL